MQEKNNKLIQYIILLIFFVVLSITFWNQYISFHKEKIEIQKIKQKEKERNESFKISDINNIEEIELFSTPNKELLENIVLLIENAQSHIYIEMYMFTENRIREALIKAKNRGIDIKVILEKSPYLASNINNKTYEEFIDRWIEVVWSNPDNYTFNHSKIILIDSLSIISTWNLTYSTFTQNRDLFLFIKDENISKNLLMNFNNDFAWKKESMFYENVIISPNNSRSKLTKLLEEADKKIIMYVPYFDDELLLEKIINLKQEKEIEITIIFAKTAENEENTKILKEKWIKVYIIPKYKMHSKAILVDDKYLFIWSINFSKNSIDYNREYWLLIKEEKIIYEFQNIFESDL